MKYLLALILTLSTFAANASFISSTRIDELTGATTQAAIYIQEEGSMVAACNSKGELAVTIVTPRYIRGNTTKVEWRLDEGAVQSSYWMAHSGNGVVIMGEEAKDWLLSLAEAEQAIVRVHTARGSFTNTYKGAGLIGIMRHWQKCGL